MSEVHAFLARAVPWPLAGEPGYINIHWLNRDDATRAPRGMGGRAFSSHSVAAGYAMGMLKVKTDIFVCMSLQRNAVAGFNKAGKPAMRAMRHSSDALLIRSFWADIDVKPGFFLTTVEAKAAFDAWRIKVGLPEPTFIVLTGSGGFHVHWILDDPITRDAWLPLAHALQNALRSHQFPCDYGVVIDAARLLRIPGTINYKDPANPHPATLDQALNYTYPLSIFEKALAPYKVSYVPSVTGPPAKGLPAGMVPNPKLAGLPQVPRLDAGIDQWVPSLEDVIHGGCLWLGELKASHGASCSEPEWFEAMKVCSFLEEGPDLAHELSSGHPGYTEADTDRKYQQAALTHGNGRYGWPQCQTINAAGATACTRCPHLAKGRSPLNYAQPASPSSLISGTIPPPPPPQPASPNGGRQPDPSQPNMGFGELPSSYRYTPEGLVEEGITEDDETRWEAVLPMPLYDLEPYRKTAEGQGHSGMQFKVQTDASNLDVVRVTLGDLSDNRQVQKVCGEQNVSVSKPLMLRKLLMSFRDQLWARKHVAKNSEGFGWSFEQGQAEPSGFCYGGLRYTLFDKAAVTPVEIKLAAKYMPCGSLQYWKDAADLIIGQQRPDLIAIIASTLGAPLTYWTGHAGIVLSAYSSASGIGKSHAMRIGQSFWGSPTIGMGGLDDTAGYVGARVALLRHLPFFFDELRQEEDIKKLVTMIFAMGQGKSKGRLTPSAEARDVHEFSTMMAVASNNSLLGYINDHVKTTAAGVNRIFEIPVATVRAGPGLIDSTVAQRINGGLNTNYGHPGAVYAEWLGKNIPAVKLQVGAVAEEFNRLLGANHDERFWISTITVIALGARYGNHLGLTKIDEPKLVAYLMDQFHKNRLYRNTSSVDIDQGDNVVRYLEEYINVRRENTLITDKVWTQTSRPPATFKPLIVNHEGRFDGKLVIRVAKDDQVLRILLSDFGLWLKKDKGVSRDVIVNALIKAGGKRIKTNIGANTKHSTAREDGLEFDLKTMPHLFP